MPLPTAPDGDIDVLCVGETLVDFIAVENTPWLKTAETFRRHLGGSPANIALYVAKLGGRSAISSKTGIGAFGQFLKGELRSAGVLDEYFVMDHRVHTTVVFVSRTAGTPEFEALRQGDAELRPEEIPDSAVDRSKVVHASSFAASRRPCRDAIESVFTRARERNTIVSFDPNYSPTVWPNLEDAREAMGRLLAMAHLSKPSIDDCHRFFGDDVDPAVYVERFHDLGVDVVVLTMGKDGILLSEGGPVTHVPTRPIQVRDATGAGDSFWAGFLTALVSGEPLERCVLFARGVVEVKLQAVGHIEGHLDRDAIWAGIGS